MASSTVENYVKRLYIEQQNQPEGLVPMGRLATLMEVVPGTATSMVKTLADAGLVHYEPRSGTSLTPGGEQLALAVLRRHRLLELFLVEVLGLDWTEVHEEAETLEHAISDKVLEKMDSHLGHPSVDPHGDPIPTASGDLRRPLLRPLGSCAVGECPTVRRILDQDPAFLQFVSESAITPGTRVCITEHHPQAAALTVTPDQGTPVILGSAAAAKILVEGKMTNDEIPSRPKGDGLPSGGNAAKRSGNHE